MNINTRTAEVILAKKRMTRMALADALGVDAEELMEVKE